MPESDGVGVVKGLTVVDGVVEGVRDGRLEEEGSTELLPVHTVDEVVVGVAPVLTNGIVKVAGDGVTGGRVDGDGDDLITAGFEEVPECEKAGESDGDGNTECVPDDEG